MGYSRVKISTATKKLPLKLYFYTAKGLQCSRCSKIGSPAGEKMQAEKIDLFPKVPAYFMNSSGKDGLFTSEDCSICEATAHEGVVLHSECVATKQML